MGLRKNNVVLMLGPLRPPYSCGIRTSVHALLESHLAKKYKILFLKTSPSKHKVSLLYRFFWFAITTVKLFYIILRKRPDVAHIHTSSYLGFFEKIMFTFVLNLSDVPVILHVHGAEFKLFYSCSNNLKRWLIRASLRLPDRIVCMSESWKCFFSQLVTHNKLCVIPNAVVNLERRGGKSFDYFQQHEIPHDKCIILFLGNLTKRKGIFDIVDAINAIKDKEKIILLFVGDGEDGESLALYVRKKELSNLILFLPPMDGKDKEEAYLNSDVFVLPSYAEGMPFALLEAMAAGLPVITTPVGAIPEVVQHEKTGLIVKPGDVQQLAHAIHLLCANVKVREKLGNKGREKVRKRYCMSQMLESFDALYKRL